LGTGIHGDGKRGEERIAGDVAGRIGAETPERGKEAGRAGF
jgi:hypothetical protein